MKRIIFSPIAIFAFIQFLLSIGMPPTSLSKEWEFRRPKGILKIVPAEFASACAAQNYTDSLVALDKDNRHVPGLAEDWRRINDRTIEFKLRRGVTFHNGEEFNAESVRINWEAYKAMETPRVIGFTQLSDETDFEIINKLMGDRKEAMRLCRETEGNVDLVSNIRPLDTLKVAESPYAKVVKSKDVSLLAGWINQRKKNSKWRDIRLRKALNYAINRKELWKYGARGNAHNLGGFIPPGAYGHNPDLKLYNYDTTRARALLAEAGYPDGFDVKIITYEEMWKEMARTVDRNKQEDLIRQMVKYSYDRAVVVYTYSPLTLYAVNKEVRFVPQKGLWLRLKETSVTDKHWSIRAEKK